MHVNISSTSNHPNSRTVNARHARANPTSSNCAHCQENWKACQCELHPMTASPTQHRDSKLIWGEQLNSVVRRRARHGPSRKTGKGHASKREMELHKNSGVCNITSEDDRDASCEIFWSRQTLPSRPRHHANCCLSS